MKAVIVGCGRVGAELAQAMEAAGYDVVVIDVRTAAFDRLPSSFHGHAVRADGTDEEALRRAGAEHAEVFLALTEGDNRNVMAAQLAVEALGASKVVAKINDPVRAAAYAELGLATLCRTNLMQDAINAYVGLPLQHRDGVVPPLRSHADEHRDPDVVEPTRVPPSSVAADAAALVEPGAALRRGLED